MEPVRPAGRRTRASRSCDAVALVALAAASTVLRTIVGGWVHGPRVFMDELGYERMAQSFAHTGHFSLFGKSGLAYSPLYPIVLSPIYALTSSAQTAYEWAKVENAVLISLSVFPVYAIARTVLRRDRALALAALSLVAPLMLYSDVEMSESLAYPLCLVAIWAMLRAVRRPSLGNDAHPRRRDRARVRRAPAARSARACGRSRPSCWSRCSRPERRESRGPPASDLGPPAPVRHRQCRPGRDART